MFAFNRARTDFNNLDTATPLIFEYDADDNNQEIYKQVQEFMRAREKPIVFLIAEEIIWNRLYK